MTSGSKIGSLFSGIGGLELGLEMSGIGETIWQVEQNPFCLDVLAKHWPETKRYTDVRTVGAQNLEPVDLICGGFPCQDISSAGKGAGLAGSRSGLWFEYARIIEVLRPEWVVVENVASGARRWVDQVRVHLGQLGYETLPVPLSAKDVGAPHLRKRVFIVAHAAGNGRKERLTCRPAQEFAAIEGAGSVRSAAHADMSGKPAGAIDEEVAKLQRSTGFDGWHGGATVSPVCGVDDGISGRMDRLRGLGNAVVPQCAEVIGWMIREMKDGAL